MNVATPNLRFKTYSKPWEVQALGKLGSFLGGGTPSTENRVYWSGDIPWVSSSDIKEGDFFGINLHRFITEDAIKNSATKKVPENSLLIVSRVGVGKFAVCRHEVCTSQDFTSFTPENCSIDFIAYQLYKNKNRLINLGQGTTIKGFTTGDLASFKLHIPEKAEQKKIADFLTSVDTKISHLTEKQRLLKDYKKGVIQQIFSQQIRFKDDDGKAFPEWQVKTIGDVMTESRIKGSSGDVAKKLTVKIWGKGVIPKKDDSKGSENTQYYKRKAGQFIYGKLDFLNCAFAIIPDELDGYESTLDLPSLDVSSLVNKFFVLEVVKQKRFYKRFGEIADGSRKAKRINVGVFQEMPITLPSKAEQNKIMAFLDSLDKKTNAVNEQIEQTKLFKKGLLQQMFV